MNTAQIYYYIQGSIKGKAEGSWNAAEVQELQTLLREAISTDTSNSLEKRVCYWLQGYLAAQQMTNEQTLSNLKFKGEFIEFVTKEHSKLQHAPKPIQAPEPPRREEQKPFSGGVVFREQLKLRC